MLKVIHFIENEFIIKEDWKLANKKLKFQCLVVKFFCMLTRPGNAKNNTKITKVLVYSAV